MSPLTSLSGLRSRYHSFVVSLVPFSFASPYADSHFHSFATTLPRDSKLFPMGLAALPQWRIPVAQFFIPLDIGNQIYQELPKESMGFFFQGFFLESVGL